MAANDQRSTRPSREDKWFSRTRLIALGFAVVVVLVAMMLIVISRAESQGRIVWYVFSLFPLACLLGVNAVATFYERNTMRHGGRAVLHDDPDR